MQFKEWIIKHKVLFGISSITLLLLLCRSGARMLWMDETAVLEYVQVNPIQFVYNYFAVPDNHPPLYYFLVNVLFHVIPLHSIILIRCISIFAGLGIVIVLYYTAQLLFDDKKMSIWTAILAATSSYFILIAQMARYHSLAALCTLLALYNLLKILKNQGNQRKNFVLFIATSALIGWSDYPHFIYFELLINTYYIYRWVIVKSKIIALSQWIVGQIIVAVSFTPMLWLIYERVVYQGDGGFMNINALGNGVKHLATAFCMHIYAYFFGENIFPWDWLVFIPGVLVLICLFGVCVYILIKKRTHDHSLLAVYTCLAFIGINTVLLNKLDPRYNFIVYPKYVFVAFPLFVLAVVSLVRILPTRMRAFVLSLYLIINMFGLYNFYQARNYINASYFNSFSGLEYVRAHARSGDRLVINGDVNGGVYAFLKDRYFHNLIPTSLEELTELHNITSSTRIWFFTTASDDANKNNSTDSKIPTGFTIVDRLDTVPLDATLRKYKERLTGYASYTYKYSVFLLKIR